MINQFNLIDMLIRILLLLTFTGWRLVIAQPYPTATVISNLLLSASLPSTFNPLCGIDYVPIWQKQSNGLLLSKGGNTDYATIVNYVVNSTDGFNSYSLFTPLMITPGQPHYPRSAGGIAREAPPSNIWFEYQGIAFEAEKLIVPFFTTDLFNTYQLTVPNDMEGSTPWNYFSVTASMPYQNWTIIIGGICAGVYELFVYWNGCNEVWYTINDGFTWIQRTNPVPFPPFKQGAMVALFDSAAVPQASSIQTFSTLILIVDKGVYVSVDGAQSWTVKSPGPWNMNPELGNRQGGALAVDADNFIYYLGGNTATGDLYFSSTAGSSWVIVPIGSATGQPSYGASFSSCLAIRYPTPDQKNLVLFSGQIYTPTDLNLVSPSLYTLPTPSLYSLTFNLSFSSQLPTPTPTPPPALLLGQTAPTKYWFYYTISASSVFERKEYWQVCSSGTMTVLPHVQYFGTSPQFVYQQVVGATGVRIYSNTTHSISQNILGSIGNISGLAGGYCSQYLFPLTNSKADADGICFLLDGLTLVPGGAPLQTTLIPPNIYADYTTFLQHPGDFYQNNFIDGEAYVMDNDASGSSVSISTSNNLPSCTVGILAPPSLPPLPSDVLLPQITGCQGTGDPRSIINNGLQCPLESINLFTTLNVNNIGPSFAVQLGYNNNWYPGLFSSLVAPGQIGVAPIGPTTGYPNNTWISAVVINPNGTSDPYPVWLFNSDVISPSTSPSAYPPAIFSVSPTGNCISYRWISNIITTGGVACTPQSLITIFGSYFTSTSKVTVDGVLCSSLSFVSATQLNCLLPALPRVTSSYTSVPILVTDFANGFIYSNTFSLFSLVLPPSSSSSSSSSLSNGAIAGVVIGCVVGAAILLCLVYSLICFRSMKASTTATPATSNSKVSIEISSKATVSVGPPSPSPTKTTLPTTTSTNHNASRAAVGGVETMI